MVDIGSVSFGEIEINGKIYYSDMVVWWNGKVEYREKRHILTLDEFIDILKKKPEVVVVGTGMSGCVRIDEKAKVMAGQKGVGIYTEISPKAAEIFNGFVKDRKKAVAVMHTTC